MEETARAVCHGSHQHSRRQWGQLFSDSLLQSGLSSLSLYPGKEKRQDLRPVAMALTSLPTQDSHYTCCATWSMSPSCPWISWDKSRSRVTGLLCKTCRLKKRLIKLLQNEASSRSRKGRSVNHSLLWLLQTGHAHDAVKGAPL